MRRSVFVAGAATVMLTSVAAITQPVQATPEKRSVVIVAHTVLGPEPSSFDSNLPGCETGTVIDTAGGPYYTPQGGIFVGLKEFTCADGESGFTLRLIAHFSARGSSGRWTLTDGWGDYAGARGSGPLIGIPRPPTTIDDVYTGVLR